MIVAIMNPTSPQPETFEELCSKEQRALDENLADVEFLSLRRSYQQAAYRFAELRHQLEDHIRTEEELVLPLFLEQTGDQELAQRIREEHRQIEQLVEAVASAISQWDRARFIVQVADLRSALKAHHEDEAVRLHPSLGSVLRTAADWWLLCFPSRTPT